MKYFNISNIKEIIKENNNLYVVYLSGVKRKINNKYFYYNMIDYIKRNKNIYDIIPFMDIIQDDLKRYYKTKNMLYLWKFKNICKYNNLKYSINGVIKKGFLKVCIYTELKENIKNFFLNCENVIFKEISKNNIELLIIY